MESAIVDPLIVGGKRSAEKDCDERLHKKARFDASGDLKRVGEIVLVLSALGKMRSGRCPTLEEKKLMDEAREKLVEICEGIAPEDVLPTDAVRVLIEDLGLDRSSRDQKLGFMLPKMSIMDKFLLTKKKMEDSKRFAPQSVAYSSQRPKVGFAAKSEIPATMLHASPQTVPRTITVPIGGFEPASLASATSNKLPTNEMRSVMVYKGLPSSTIAKGSSSLPLVQGAALSDSHKNVARNVQKILQQNFLCIPAGLLL